MCKEFNGGLVCGDWQWEDGHSSFCMKPGPVWLHLFGPVKPETRCFISAPAQVTQKLKKYISAAELRGLI